jgi:hypothetical protein
MKFVDVFVAYDVLGNASMSTLDVESVGVILDNRMLMRSRVDEYKALLADAQEKFKPENYDEIMRMKQNWNNLSANERELVNTTIAEYSNKLGTVLEPKLNEEIDIELKKISLKDASKLMVENKWTPNDLDKISIIIGK